MHVYISTKQDSCVLMACSAMNCPPGASEEPRRRLRRASSADLLVLATRRSTVDDRTFAVAGPRARNSLSETINLRRSQSLDAFQSALYFRLLGPYMKIHENNDDDKERIRKSTKTTETTHEHT